MTAVLLGALTGVYRWQLVKWREDLATREISPYGGVFWMASAQPARASFGQTRFWIYATFFNYVEIVDLSPHTFAAVERRGAIRPVTDESLVVLYKLPKLRSLSLRDTQITDNGVRHVKSLKHLEHLDVTGTGITEAGLRELRMAIPNCRVRWQDDEGTGNGDG
jgi:hypothetical protein